LLRPLAFVLASSLPICAAAAGSAAGAPLTPLTSGFHQLLKCNGGYVTIDVAPADPSIAPHASLVTTAIAVGPALTRTKAARIVDGQGNIYALGYEIAPGAFKRFPQRLLLPAAPPQAGERSTYFNIGGVAIEKHFDGPAATRDARARPAAGFAFSDYLSGHKLNTVVYVPAIGITEARFFGVAGGHDLICRLAPA